MKFRVLRICSLGIMFLFLFCAHLPMTLAQTKSSLILKSPTSLLFPTVQTDTEQLVQTIPIQDQGLGITLRDTRSNVPGWTLTATSTNLAGVTASIAVTNLRLIPKSIAATIGTINGTVLGTPIHFTSETNAILIAQANIGSGFGEYTVNADLELTIPPNTPAANYSGTLTFTIQ